MASAAQTPVVIARAPAASLPSADGTGLCIATKKWTGGVNSVPQTADSFASGMNAFFEASPQPQKTSVHRGLLDLSNALNDGRVLSYGDFIGAACSQSSQAGCPFVFGDSTTTFGARLRGFMRVGQSSVGHPIHFGVYADDAMSLTIFDGAGQTYAALMRPPQLGAPTWRITNAVTFPSPGLYPIEILYAQITEHAALEISTYDDTFTDFERGAGQAPVVNLQSLGFGLLDPKDLHQSEEGGPSLPDLDSCQQCAREFAGQPGTSGCSAGYHCNAAALCSACVSGVVPMPPSPTRAPSTLHPPRPPRRKRTTEVAVVGRRGERRLRGPGSPLS
nr:outer membrane exchange protein TraA family protein [Labilithrix luteola]